MDKGISHNRIGTSEGVGRNKYQFLKSMPKDQLSDADREAMADYESRFLPTPEQLALKKAYADSLFSEKPTISQALTKGWLWQKFLENFRTNEGVEFCQNPDTISNVKTVMLYFLRHEDFFKCDNVHPMSKPRFEKGLLIVGDYGVGKSAIMKAMQRTLYGIKGLHFRYFNANEVVKLFEAIDVATVGPEFNRKQFDHSMTTGAICFDDLKTERDASNFGKVNLFKEILEIRSQKTHKTYATINYRKELRGDVMAAVAELSDRYGERVYDRVFEMFNVIEFRGKSHRL